MDKKTFGIITVVVSTFLCGLPGLAGLCFGSLAILGAFFPDSGVPSEDTVMVAGISVMTLGLSLVFIAIPIGVGFLTWWSQKSEAVTMEKLLIPEDDF